MQCCLYCLLCEFHQVVLHKCFQVSIILNGTTPRRNLQGGSNFCHIGMYPAISYKTSIASTFTPLAQTYSLSVAWWHRLDWGGHIKFGAPS